MDSISRRIKDIVSTYDTDTVFILGKGPSIDEIDQGALSGALTIGVNDAERIHPVDITVFHDEWVERAIADNGYASRLYITSTDFRPAQGEVLKVDSAPVGSGESDEVMQRLVDDVFLVEDVLFVSALKIARLVGRLRRRKQDVYMLGFDFQASHGHATAVAKDYAGDSVGLAEARVDPQRYYFLHALYTLKDSEVVIHHVGDQTFSDTSARDFNTIFGTPQPSDVAGHLRGAVSIVAEITTNHFGELSRLEKLVRSAKAAGADYVKLQRRDVETFYPKEQLDAPYVSPFGSTFRDYRRALELSKQDFEFVDRLCSRIGIQWFASALDKASFQFLLDFSPELIKLPSTISGDTSYLSYVAENYAGGVVVSTGMTEEGFSCWAAETFREASQLCLMQCTSAYPTPPGEASVAVVRWYRDLSRDYPNLVPGYSSHDSGWLGSALAVAAGARMVEKHIKWGSTEWAHFDVVALDASAGEFSEYVRRIREAELVLGSEGKTISASEHHKYR